MKIVLTCLVALFACSVPIAAQEGSSTIHNIRNPFIFIKKKVKKIVKPIEKPKPKLVTKKEWTKKPVKKKPELVLNGVFKGDEGEYVLINQDLLNLGDLIEGWRLSQIRTTYVILKKGKQTKRLNLK